MLLSTMSPDSGGKYTLCTEKKEEKCVIFCNIFYKTGAILIKLGK